jgi:hypothetical protein
MERKKFPMPITVAARSKAWNVFARSNTGIVGSTPTRGIDDYLLLFCVCVSCVGIGLATGLVTRPRSPTDCLQDP